MSKRKALDLDILGESHLPDDLFTVTDGSNWMLDTFPDLGKGMGVLDGQVLQEPRQAPNLPDGDVSAGELTLGEDQVLFGSLIDVEASIKEAGLTDLSWLELAEQDPECLPDNPIDNGIPELEEAWGAHRRTDGISLLPNVDLEVASYEASLEAPVAGPTASHTEVEEVVRKASRRVASGASFQDVAVEVATKLGPDAHLARSGMERVRGDAGLLGRVFIRASDYPGCDNGTWAQTVRKQAATASYVVAKKACGGCVHAQDGSCSVFKKRIVAAVPWDDAVRRYGPALAATGRPITADLDPKEALRRSFAKAPVGISQVGDVRPHHLVAADQVTPDEARRAFAEAPRVSPTVVDVTAEKAIQVLARWKSSGMLSQADIDRLEASGASGKAVLQAGAKLILAARRAQ